LCRQWMPVVCSFSADPESTQKCEDLINNHRASTTNCHSHISIFCYRSSHFRSSRMFQFMCHY
jgi:hypothetical protein